ncbi:MAG: hypothetical protein M0C28_12415 [Candidatus Moduliflexus flocculans]|nr:hypothetical protein [Candidatus Moduliflexus flocculans]
MRRVHALNFVRTMAVTTIAFLAPLRFLALGFDGVAIGLIVALFASAPMIFSFPTGWLNDRVSMKAVMGAALLAMSAAVPGLGDRPERRAHGRGLPAPGRGQQRLQRVHQQPVLQGRDRDGPEPQVRPLSSDGSRSGRRPGSCSAASSSRVSGFRTLLGIMAALTLVAAAAVRGLGEERFAAVSIRDYRFSVFNKRTLLFSAFLVLMALHWGTELTVYGPFLRTRLGLSDSGVALYMAGAYLALASAAFLVGRLKFDPVRNRRLFLAGMTISGLGLVLMTVGDVRLSFLFRFIHEGGDGLMGAFAILTMSRLFETKTIGGSAGILMALQTTGHMAGSLLFSWMGFRAGLQVPMIVAGLVLLANAAFGLYAVPKE